VIVHAVATVVLSSGLHLQAAPSNNIEPCARTPVECAMPLVEQGRFDAAIAALTKALAGNPRDVRALNLLGIALTGAGQRESANRRFRQALAIDAHFQPARKNLAVNEFDSGRLAAAEPLFKAVLAELADDEVAHIHLAEIHYARKQFDRALPHYEKSGDRPLTRPAWTLHYASCLLDRREAARAITLLNRLPSDDGASRFEAGVVLGRAREFVEAARHFAMARSTYKDAYAAGYNQVLMLIEAGDHAAAIRVAGELFEANHRTGELHNLAARAYVGSNRIQEAYDALRTAARLEPAQEQHYLDLALICLDHENFDLGMEIIDVGLRHVPAAPRLHVYRGVLLVSKGLVEQAAEEFLVARKLGPDGPVPDVALAMALMQSGQTTKAVALLRQRARTTTRDATVRYMLGLAIMRSGVSPADAAAGEAIQAFEDAVRLDPALTGPRAELGKILLARGETAKAIEQLEKASSLDPDNPAPAYLLAQAYRKSGNVDRARLLLARVSTLNAQGRGDDPDRELKRTVLRIVREAAMPPSSR
jgi:Flp pilus assembly protein TadD